MTWEIRWRDKARKEFLKLDKPVQRRIAHFLIDRVAKLADPRDMGKPLVGEKGEIWRYRVGNYRLLCQIDDGKLTVLVVGVGHRKHIYRNR
ncbi:MAG: type II toxin-antitoxin system mRNA interferase toxin, RelE/StbE family [Gammaproteobacteria bacterium]|nr:MAG: type II toxin-antitoxin system mRNA interferase toxin, RelE/StbE family [Gammaproteobacteria bacterium]